MPCWCCSCEDTGEVCEKFIFICAGGTILAGLTTLSLLVSLLSTKAMYLIIAFWTVIFMIIVVSFVVGYCCKKKLPRQESLRVISDSHRERISYRRGRPQIVGSSVSTSAERSASPVPPVATVQPPQPALPVLLSVPERVKITSEASQSSSTPSTSGTFNYNERSRAYPGAAPFDPKNTDSPIPFISTPTTTEPVCKSTAVPETETCT